MLAELKFLLANKMYPFFLCRLDWQSVWSRCGLALCPAGKSGLEVRSFTDGFPKQLVLSNSIDRLYPLCTAEHALKRAFVSGRGPCALLGYIDKPLEKMPYPAICKKCRTAGQAFG